MGVGSGEGDLAAIFSYHCLTCGREVATLRAGPVECGHCKGVYLKPLANGVPMGENVGVVRRGNRPADVATLKETPK